MPKDKLNPKALETYKSDLIGIINSAIKESIGAIPNMLDGVEKREQLAKDRDAFIKIILAEKDSNEINGEIDEYIKNSKTTIAEVKEAHKNIAEKLEGYLNNFEVNFANIQKTAEANNSSKQVTMRERLDNKISDAEPFFENSNHRYAYNEAFDKLDTNQKNGL